MVNNNNLIRTNKIIFSKEKRQLAMQLPSLPIFKHWNEKGKPLPKHRIDFDSKIFKRVNKIAEKLLRKYSLENIKKSIDVYYELVNNPNVNLNKSIPGHIVGLNDFFEFTNFTKQRIQRSKVKLDIKSWFYECLKGKGLLEKKYGEVEPDYFPLITKEFIRLWWEYSGMRRRKLSIKEVNKFRITSQIYVRWWYKNKKNLNLVLLSKIEFVKYVFEAILLDIGKQEWAGLVSIGWLCSKKTFSDRLTIYLMRKGILEKNKNKENYVVS